VVSADSSFYRDAVDAYNDVIVHSNYYKNPPGSIVINYSKSYQTIDMGFLYRTDKSFDITVHIPEKKSFLIQLDELFEKRQDWTPRALAEELHYTSLSFNTKKCKPVESHLQALLMIFQGDVLKFVKNPSKRSTPMFEEDPEYPDMVMLDGESLKVHIIINRFHAIVDPAYYSRLGFHIRKITEAVRACSDGVEATTNTLSK